MFPAPHKSFSGPELDFSSNMMAHDDAREVKWRGNRRMEWVASTLHTTSEHGVSSITTADAHTSAASTRLNWRPRRFKWTRPFREKTKSGFCACAIIFQPAFIQYAKFPIVPTQPPAISKHATFYRVSQRSPPLVQTNSTPAGLTLYLYCVGTTVAGRWFDPSWCRWIFLLT